MSKPTLQVKDLVVSYGPIVALKGVSMDVFPGQVVAILGRGRMEPGKTTLLRTISGLIRSQEGSIVLFDQDITKIETEKGNQGWYLAVP